MLGQLKFSKVANVKQLQQNPEGTKRNPEAEDKEGTVLSLWPVLVFSQHTHGSFPSHHGS